MAVIGRIRKRVGLLIGFVGISMLAFILGDVLTSSSGFMGGDSDVVGEVGGEQIRYREFESRVEKMIENYKINTQSENLDPSTQDMLREQAWGMFVNENTLGKEYEKLGLNVSSEELYDMITGPNPHPQIRQAFTDPNTKQFNSADVVKFLKDLPNREENIQQQWSAFEDAIVDEKIAAKYKDLIKNGLYVTSVEAQRADDESKRTASIRYIRMDYVTVPDSTIQVEDSELNKYYNANQKKYMHDQTTRAIEYVSFDVVPSEEDRKEVINWMEEKEEEFATTSDPVAYVNQHSDEIFDSTYFAKGTLKPVLDTVLFDASEGTMVGPYEENNAFKLSRLVGTKMVSDSVKARHILIKIENGDSAKAFAKADSLKNAIKKGSSFASLASQFSQDPGSAIKGGDLGWFRQGAMVKPFNDACFNGNKGDMPVVASEFGVHLIEILDKSAGSKQIQVATLERKFEPSQKTYDSLFNQAINFANENNTAEKFDAAILKQGLNKRIAENVKETDKNLPGFDSPRELIRWAYQAEPGDVSKVFTLGEKYVIAHLTSVKEKGVLPLEQVKEQVTAEVRKQKKADMLAEKINAAKAPSLDEMAQKLNVTVSEAENISFANNYITGMGNEPAIVGAIFAAKEGQISQPVKGENAVVVFSVKAFNKPESKDFMASGKQLLDQRKSRSEYELFNALKDNAEIIDNRGRIY